MAEDLDILDPQGSRVRYQGDEVEVLPITIGRLPRFVRALQPMLGELSALAPMLDGDDGIDALLPAFVGLIGEHGERLQEAVAIAINRDVAFVAAGGLDEFVELAVKVVKVNADFFAKRLVPRFAAVRASADSNSAGAGSTHSSS